MRLRGLLLGGAALAAVATPAFADDATILKRLDDMQRMMELQQKQIAAQRNEINALRGALRHKGVPVAPVQSAEAAAPAPAPLLSVEDKIAAQQAAINALDARVASSENRARIEKGDAATFTIANGRPTFTSADQRFTSSSTMR